MTTYICTELCLVDNQRFRVGQELPDFMVPTGEKKPKWFNHFQPLNEGKKTIQEKKLQKLGVDPARERSMRAKVQGVKDTMAQSMDIEEPEAEKDIDFLYVTDEEGEQLGSAALVKALVKYGVKADAKMSVSDLLDMGRDAALSISKEAAAEPKKKPRGRPPKAK